MLPPSGQDERPLGSSSGSDGSGSARVSAPAELSLTLTAEWAAASIVRHRVERWLHAHRWSPAHIGDLVLAISEAVSNSIEHGYSIAIGSVAHSGVIELHGRVATGPDGFRRAEFTVRDEGCWRDPTNHTADGGRGILLMRACADTVTIDGAPTGTTVVLSSKPIPPLR